MPVPLCYGRRMTPRLRNDIGLVVAGIAVAAGALAIVVGRVDMGFSFEGRDDYTRIAEVRANSPAEREGFSAGMVVISVNDVQLVRLPQYVYPEEAEPTLEPEATPPAEPSPSSEPTAEPTTSPTAVRSGESPAVVAASPEATPPPTPTPSPAPTSAPTAAPTQASTPGDDSGVVEPGTGVPGPTPYLDPPTVTVTGADRYAFASLVSTIGYLEAVPAEDLDVPGQGSWNVTYLGHSYPGDLSARLPGLLAGIVILAAAFLFGGALGASWRSFAGVLAVATATPLLTLPLVATWWGPAIALAGVLVPLGMAPLAEALGERISDPDVRQHARLTSAAALTGAVTLGLVRPFLDASGGAADGLYYALVAAVPVVPVLAAIVAARANPAALAGGAGPVQSSELVAAAGTPVAGLATAVFWNPLLVPLSVWLASIAVAAGLTVRPLARLLSRAQLQRDLVVAATETERARVAADIHDDALQELTLLVRRLDAAGDTESAEMARGVTERLRAICGDLRLPILDDLGVGPALDWLVQRIDGIAGGEVRLERSDGVRPPREVELAFFRVAQEAFANAARHGRPPIVVRYHATDAGAVLTVDDAGAGIDPGAADAAERAGRFGLLNMRQRAEQIGAILDIRPWPGGGTHVGLQWRPQ